MKSSRQSILLGLFAVSLVFALNGCANFDIVKPVVETDPFLMHRWYALGAAIGLGFIQICCVAAMSDNPGFNHAAGEKWFTQNFSAIFFGIPLLWTKIGEWGYLINDAFFNAWNPLPGVFSFFSGLQGNVGGVLSWIVLFGFVFPVSNLFYWTALPTLVGTICNIILLLVNSSRSNSQV